MEIALSPIMNYIIEIAFTVLIVFGTWLAKVLVNKFDLQNYLPFIDRAISDGLNNARKELKKKYKDEKITIDMENEMIETALTYVKDYAPKAIKKTGFNLDQIKQEVGSRVTEFLDNFDE